MAEEKMTREERRAKMNAMISDAEMAMATGGVEGDQPEPKFKVGDRFKDDTNHIFDGYVTGIYEYYPQWHEWIYQVHILDKDGWFDDLYEESNMEPY